MATITIATKVDARFVTAHHRYAFPGGMIKTGWKTGDYIQTDEHEPFLVLGRATTQGRIVTVPVLLWGHEAALTVPEGTFAIERETEEVPDDL